MKVMTCVSSDDAAPGVGAVLPCAWRPGRCVRGAAWLYEKCASSPLSIRAICSIN